MQCGRYYSNIYTSDVRSLYYLILDIKDTVEPCYDTSALRRKEGAGWTYRNISLERILRFVGLHAHVIHREDPKVRSSENFVVVFIK